MAKPHFNNRTMKLHQEEVMSYGFTEDELEELERQGVQPWDPQARELLSTLTVNDEHDDEDDYMWRPPEATSGAGLSAGDYCESFYDAETGETYIRRGVKPPAKPQQCREEEVYVAEEIVGERLNDGTTEYKVKWQHYSLWDATWETSESLENYGEYALSLLKEYETREVAKAASNELEQPLTKNQLKNQKKRAAKKRAAEEGKCADS